MPTFKTRIQQALAKPAPSHASNELAPEYEKVLTELVEALEEARPSLQVVIETQGRSRCLVVSPRYRRNETSIALSFRCNGSGVRVAIKDEQDFQSLVSPDELREWLVGFVNDVEFRETIDEYGETAEENVVAVLRMDGDDVFMRDNAFVIISAEEQRRIATAMPGQMLHIRGSIEEEDSSGMAPYNSIKPYCWLMSGGYELRVTDHELEDEDVVVITGVVEDDIPF